MNEYWENKVKESNADHETKKVREDLQIQLTDKQYINLKLMAYKAGFDDAAQLLASFVGDLTGWQDNGSDERDKASDWFERAFGSHEYYSYFRYHLFNNDFSIEDMRDMIDDEEWFEDTYSSYIEEFSHMTNQTKEECLAELRKIVEEGKEL